ncbi:hypothetical protein [Pseudomonas sp. NPDC096950]|uniref:hypothetical protein n=1 Tax=Pseudomonas sp. NPDC096950 TaxID=3364485 RepID=UPI00383B40BB
MAWYIDTMDAPAGYAFATKRMPDLEGDRTLADNADTFFIEAPHFVAERVSSRAIAFGATRGRFQAGLYQGASEVSFPSLSAVSEFVRRCYGSGGGADEGGPGTPVGPGPNEPQPDRPRLSAWRAPSGERPEREQTDPVRTLEGAFGSFQEQVQARHEELASIEPSSFLELTAQPTERYGEDSALRLARAALRLILEVNLIPEAADPEQRWAIDESGRRLYACISRMGLWVPIYRLLEADQQAFGLAKGAVGWNLINLFEHIVGRTRDELTVVHLLGLKLFAGREDLSIYENIISRSRYSFDYHMGIFSETFHVGVALDRFADISHIVIPAVLIPEEYRPRQVAPTLRNLIAFACNSPTKIPANFRQEVCETLLFGACYLNGSTGSNHFMNHSVPYDIPNFASSESQLANIHRMVTAAMAWLKTSFPTCAFSPALESIIADTASLKKKI